MTVESVAFCLKKKDVRFGDLRSTYPHGKWQHLTLDAAIVDQEALTEGVMCDGSSIAGWKIIDQSDMQLPPDLASAVIDRFFEHTAQSLACDVIEPTSGTPYPRCPRSIDLAIAQRAGDFDTSSRPRRPGSSFEIAISCRN